MQEEAALRLCQIAPGAADYRAMTVEVQCYSRARCLFTVPRAEFTPVPKVNGVVVEFAIHTPAERAVVDSAAFIAMVRANARASRYLNMNVTFMCMRGLCCNNWFDKFGGGFGSRDFLRLSVAALSIKCKLSRRRQRALPCCCWKHRQF